MGNNISTPETSQGSSVVQFSAGGSGRGRGLGKNLQLSERKDHELKEEDKTDGESDEENQAAKVRKKTHTGLLAKQTKYVPLSGNVHKKGGSKSTAVKGVCTTEAPTSETQAHSIYCVDALIPLNQTKGGGQAKSTSIAYKLAAKMKEDTFGGSKIPFVAGHLINRELGGLGNNTNLAVMTSSCNTVYFWRFEKAMKEIKSELLSMTPENEPKIRICVLVTRYEIWRGDSNNVYYFPAEFQVKVNLVDCTEEQREIFDNAVASRGKNEAVKRFRPRTQKEKGWILWFLNEEKSDSTNELKTESPGPCVG